jgi:hypothetical protein
MNTTHPDAKPRDERERDDIVWGWYPMGARFCITTANGTLIASGFSKEAALRICREHNRIVLR